MRASLQEELRLSKEATADFLVVPLFHPRGLRGAAVDDSSSVGLARSDLLLSGREWTASVVGALSAWPDLDSACPSFRRQSERALLQELGWAAHVGVQVVLLPAQGPRCLNYARLLKQCLASGVPQRHQTWLTVRMAATAHHRSSPSSSSAAAEGWLAWNAVRLTVGHSPYLWVALDLNELPPEEQTEEQVRRWQGEPTKCLLLHTRVFVRNKSGFPVLPRPWQRLLSLFLRAGPSLCVLLRGRPRVGSLKDHAEYVRHLRLKCAETQSEYARSFVPYYDLVQSPLQPLMDDLESSTYETFERDAPKYRGYGRAAGQALRGLSLGPGEAAVVFVVGAGRGPLVQCCLEAGAAEGVAVRVFAIEKNANAVITLRNRASLDGWRDVTVVSADMRDWAPPERAHLIVSELLGSWGCNELSPECLQPVTRHLRPDGVMVPAAYTSFVAPVTAARVWTCCRDMPGDRGLESAYVVRLHACDYLSAALPLFAFAHPSADTDHRRAGSVTFVADRACLLHGFAGTFSALLFGDATLSTVPETHTPEMHSWFPLFVPLLAPLTLDAGDTVTLNVWRCCSDKKVWYEWCLSSPLATAVQNSGGCAYWIGL